MRCLITGVDEAGRSCVVRERTIELAEVTPGLSGRRLHRTEGGPLPPRPEGSAALIDLEVEPGGSSWALWRHDPGFEGPFHHTDTVDLDVVITGSVELLLDDGAHVLEAGDCVVMNGVDHGWRAGPEGCLMSAVALGTPRRAGLVRNPPPPAR